MLINFKPRCNCLVHAGLKPVPSKTPTGPLSYLSTVTTASGSDWGSRSLDSLTQQPSDAAGMRSTGPLPPPSASVTKTNDAVITAKDSSSASVSMRRQGSSGARRSSKDAMNGVSQTQNQPQTHAGSLITDKDGPRVGAQQLSEQHRSQTKQAAFSAVERQGQSQQAASAALGAAALAVQRRQSGDPAGSQKTGWGAEDKGWSAFDSSAPSQPASLHPPSESRATASQNTAANAGDDWSAFGDGAKSAHAGASSQSTHSSERFALDSSNPFLDAPASQEAQAPGQLEMHDSNPFLDPGSMARAEHAPGQLASHASNPFLDPPGHEASDALPTHSSNASLAPVDRTRQSSMPSNQVEMHGSNPFLLPSDDAWPEDSQSRQEQAADALGVARMASGESFGDFNAPGEDDFEGTEWGGASAPAGAADWTTAAPMSTPDPFAASASFTDFAALLESGQSSLLGDADAVMSTDLSSMQQPVAGHVDLSELQHGFASNIEPADEGQQAASFAQGYGQPSGALLMLTDTLGCIHCCLSSIEEHHWQQQMNPYFCPWASSDI